MPFDTRILTPQGVEIYTLTALRLLAFMAALLALL